MNNFYGVIKCSGPDAKTFLQGQVSCDMAKITPEHSGMGAYCNLKGRVIALFFILQHENDYYLILPKDMIPTLLEKLQKFIAFSKAELIDASTEMFVYCYIGDNEMPLVSEPRPLGSGPILNLSIGPLLDSRGSETRLANSGFYLSDNPNLTLDSETTLPNWQKHLVEHKIPTISLAESEKFLPHYINLIDLNAVSFDKGCFVGQEVIARMHYRANLKKHLESHVIEGELPSDHGEVVNSVSIDGKTYVLFISHVGK